MDGPPINFELTEDDIAEAKVMIVDDESLVTGSLTNLLFLEMEIDAIAFNDPREALEHAKGNQIDAIVSDFLMPELDGIQLLSGVRDAQPHVPRILLTGYADKESAIQAINRVQLFQYIEKPWDNDALRHVIRAALERIHLIRSLTTYVDQLTSTQKDLGDLKKALMRTFA